MFSIRIENKLRTEIRNVKSRLRSFILFGSSNRVRFGRHVTLSGNLKFGFRIHIGDFSKIRGRYVIINDDVFIHENVFIRGNTNITIGKGTTINRNTCILDNVKIGEYCSIAPGCIIVGSNHKFDEREVIIKNQGSTSKGIIIGNDVWIAANVTILDGVTIGEGVVVAAGAVVTRSVEPYTVVGGVPAKQMGKR